MLAFTDLIVKTVCVFSQSAFFYVNNISKPLLIKYYHHYLWAKLVLDSYYPKKLFYDHNHFWFKIILFIRIIHDLQDT